MIRLTTAQIPAYLKELSRCGLDYRLVAGQIDGAYQLWIQTVFRDGEPSSEFALVWHRSGNRPRTMKQRSTVEHYIQRRELDLSKLTFREGCP